MAIKFTDEQQKAIDTIDKSVLVSAAAGSGKTAVLVERIINIILSGEAEVDEMLVVTFTRAAAAEMKLKLTRAIKKEITETDDRNKRKLLTAQLDKMYRAYISTFDSFALRIIKEFFHELDVDPRFKICDEVQAQLLQIEAIEELFEDCFSDDAHIDGGSFRDFLDHYSAERSEDRLTKSLISAYNSLRSMPNYLSWAYDSAEQLKIPEGGYSESPIYKALTANIKAQLSEARSQAYSVARSLEELGFFKYAERAEEDAEIIASFISELEKTGLTDSLFTAMEKPGWKRFAGEDKEAYAPYADDVIKARTIYKNKLKGLAPAFADPGIEERFEEMERTYPYTVYFINIIAAFDRLFSEKKRERGLMDFADINHSAAAILEKAEIAEALRDRFKFIFIDEYQDTNYLQEYLIGMFARDGNVFKVGDLKQSIYGFRQSEPQIFKDTAADYSSGDKAFAMTIDLNRNFRSNTGTINYINEVFKEVMQDYDEKARLYPGIEVPEAYDFKPELYALTEELLVESEGVGSGQDLDAYEGTGGESALDSEGGETDSLVDRTKTEAEAERVATLVEELIGTEFYDAKLGKIRKAEKRDIVILLRSTKSRADFYYKALMERGVTAHISDEDGYFDTVEIGVATALLTVVDNIKRDVQLIAVLHSEVFGFTPSELAIIRAEFTESGIEKAGRKPFSDAIYFYAESGNSEDIKAKVNAALSRIDVWRERSRAMSLDDFIWYLLIDSNYYLLAGAMYGGAQRQANLRVLIDKAVIYKNSGISSLGDFLRYIELLKKHSVKAGQAMMVSEDDDIVRIMTIHKSKGLEFPFVILSGIGSRFNSDKNSKGFSFDPKLGVAMSYSDREKKYWRSTLLQRLIADKKREEGFSEELRILYVAMTRAQSKLILTGIKKAGGLDSIYNANNSFFDIIRRVHGTSLCEFHEEPLRLQKNQKRRSGIEAFLRKREGFADPVSDDLYKEIDRRLSYKYPYESDLTAKAKYSVSEIRKETLSLMEIEYEDPDRIEERRTKHFHKQLFSSDSRVTAASLGIAYHRIMEFLDFERAYEHGYIMRVISELKEKGAVDAACVDEIDIEKIEGFFEAEIGKRAVAAAKSGNLKKEKPFTLKTEYNNKVVLVQGIIDVCFPEDDGYVLVDYKSNFIRGRVPESDELNRIADEYKTQIRLYAEALEKGTGLTVKEAYLYLFNAAKVIKIEY